MEELKGQRFAVIYADPPWTFTTWSAKGRGRSASRHYACLTDAELEALPVRELALPDCCLFLWSSGPFLTRSLKLMDRWGFTFKTVGFVWVKADPLVLFSEPPMATGYWTRPACEMVLLGTTGRPTRRDRAVRQVVISPRREHSRKPDEVAARIERLVDGPRLELFARRSRPGWVCWGDQRHKFDEAAE